MQNIVKPIDFVSERDKNDMTIRHLRIFNEVATSGKMSIAASKFFLSQPTVSQTIKELEEHYGVLLFERLSKKLYITEAGKQLLSYSKLVVQQFDELESKMLESTKSQKFRIGSTITVGSCLIQNVIKQYKEMDDGMEITSYVNNTQAIEEMLLKAELDIALVEGRVKSLDLISIPAIDDYLVLACNKHHPFAKKKHFLPKDLEGQEFVMREKGSGTREQFEQFLQSQGIHIKESVIANCPTAIVQSVLEQDCLAVLSVRLIEKEIKSGEIVILPYRGCTWKRCFNIVYHKNKFLSKSVIDFIQTTSSFKRDEIVTDIEEKLI